MGYANVPFAQSVYMGENAFFAFSLVGAGIPFATALGIVFWAGVLFFIISISGLRKKFGKAIPKNLSLIWGYVRIKEYFETLNDTQDYRAYKSRKWISTFRDRI